MIDNMYHLSGVKHIRIIVDMANGDRIELESNEATEYDKVCIKHDTGFQKFKNEYATQEVILGPPRLIADIGFNSGVYAHGKKKTKMGGVRSERRSNGKKHRRKAGSRAAR